MGRTRRDPMIALINFIKSYEGFLKSNEENIVERVTCVDFELGFGLPNERFKKTYTKVLNSNASKKLFAASLLLKFLETPEKN